MTEIMLAEPINFVFGLHKNGMVVEEHPIKAFTERQAITEYANLLIAEGKIERLKMAGVGGRDFVVAARPLNIIYKQFMRGSPVSGLAHKDGKYIESMAEVELEIITTVTPKITRIVKGTDWLV